MPDIDRSWLSDLWEIETLDKTSGTTTYGGNPVERRRTSFRYNEKQRRVKPWDLVSGMTALPRQHFYDETLGTHKYPYFDSWSEKVIFNKVMASYAYREYGGGLPPWDYGLKVRKRIEALEVNLGTSIVEYRQTADMFKAYAQAARNAAYRIRKLRKYRDQPRHAIAGHYLGYSYGLKPIAQDLGASVAALVSRLERPIYKRITTRKRGVYKGEERSREGIGVLFDYDVSYKRIADQRVVCYYEAKPENQGLTLGSWPEWVWEVTPFSHIVDWGFNVGEYLGSLDALNGISPLYLNYSEKVRYTHSKTLAPYETRYEGELIPSKLLKRHHVRTFSTTVPPAHFPKWKPSKSRWTIANAVATLAQCIPGRHMWQTIARHKNI